MANQNQQLTVADLEVAKERHEKMASINAPHNEMFNIAATCIGIVEEMVKCSAPFTQGKWQFTADAGTQECFVSDECTEPIASGIVIPHDAMHIAELHNLWLKAFAAFGGEVK